MLGGNESVGELHIQSARNQQGGAVITLWPQQSVHDAARRALQEPGQRGGQGLRTHQHCHQLDGELSLSDMIVRSGLRSLVAKLRIMSSK